MIIRRASTRGYLDFGWINSFRTFSNNSYWNENHRRWDRLLVINEDTQMPNNVVPKHRHFFHDILGYVVEGDLKHWDDLGNIQRATAGQIQHMFCGKGISHTEASLGPVPARYIQIWLRTDREYWQDPPSYELVDRPETFDVLPIDFKFNGKIQGGPMQGRHTLQTTSAYIYLIDGTIKGDGFELNKGDGAELTEDLTANFDCHLLMFEFY